MAGDGPLLTLYDARAARIRLSRFSRALDWALIADSLPAFEVMAALCDGRGRLLLLMTLDEVGDDVPAVLSSLAPRVGAAPAALVYSREAVSLEPPEQRLDDFRRVRAAFAAAGSVLVDWLMFGPELIRSMAFTEGVPDPWWPSSVRRSGRPGPPGPGRRG